jgi:signal transduction histidine kinase
VDVATVVERTVGLFVEYDPITVDLPSALPTVSADPERTEQILANLLANAFSYAKEPSITAHTVDDGCGSSSPTRGRG